MKPDVDKIQDPDQLRELARIVLLENDKLHKAPNVLNSWGSAPSSK
jgi:hypothetical protein